MEENSDTIKPLTVNKVVLHKHPDIDAIGACWLASKYPKVFIGIGKAPIEFWSQGLPTDGRTAEEHEKEGTICFDVGGGRFDHHPHGKCLNKCASDLVAEYVGAANDLAFRQILAYIRLRDLEGPTSLSRALREKGLPEEICQKVSLLETFSLTSVMSNTRQIPKSSDNLAKRWVRRIKRTRRQLNIAYRRQKRFWTIVKDEFDKRANIVTVSDGTRNYKIATIESNIREVGSFSRTRDGDFCSLCIQRNPDTGHAVVSGTISSEQFVEIAKILRVLEIVKLGVKETYLLSQLTESWMELCPIWYLPQDINGNVFIIMNGGEKAPEVEPSQLSLAEMRAAATVALDERLLADECPKTSCFLNSCPMYRYGLARCRAIRQVAIRPPQT